MNITVVPSSSLKGKIQLPGSKSYSIRAFLVAACGGRSRIRFASGCDDAKVALKTAQRLGASLTQSKNGVALSVHKRRKKLKSVHVRESGTVLRFILPLASFYGDEITIDGEGTLKGRPNRHLTAALRKMGLDIKGKGKKESIPVRIKGGRLQSGNIAIDGSLSSQFISALLISAPRLDGTTELRVTGKKQVSTDYIDMTLLVLKKAGIRIRRRGRTFVIKGNQTFKGLGRFDVPADLGLAAFLMAAAALVDSDIELKGPLPSRMGQADGAILSFLRRMGARFRKTSNGITIKGPFELKGGTFSLKNCPDLVPIMAVLALFARGKTRLRNIAHARVKESNRISDLRKELLKVGADIKEKRDELIITPKDTYKSGRSLDPHKDHRLAMAFAVLGLKIGARVKDIECVSKSYPKFLRDLRELGGGIRSL